MTSEADIHLDREKLKDVVHYVCAQCSQEELGNVKLHKILYYADMLKYLSTGSPLTGVEYRKQQFGPVARHLSWATSQLVAEGRLRIEKRDYFGFTKTDYLSLRHPVIARLSNEEVRLLRDVIEFVCARSAREISELSHNAAWEAAEMGEVMPYFTALGLLPDVLSEEDLAAAADEAIRIRPQIEAERRGSHSV